MKFTEEQYQKIVEFWRSTLTLTGATRAVIDYLEKEGINNVGVEALAIANPLTREWAHDKFVEKEKKYVWHLKGQHKHTDRVRLFKDLSDNSVSNYWTEQNSVSSEQEQLTESEIKSWGYNPEMFDKEEVQ